MKEWFNLNEMLTVKPISSTFAMKSLVESRSSTSFFVRAIRYTSQGVSSPLLSGSSWSLTNVSNLGLNPFTDSDSIPVFWGFFQCHHCHPSAQQFQYHSSLQPASRIRITSSFPQPSLRLQYKVEALSWNSCQSTLSRMLEVNSWEGHWLLNWFFQDLHAVQSSFFI